MRTKSNKEMATARIRTETAHFHAQTQRVACTNRQGIFPRFVDCSLVKFGGNLSYLPKTRDIAATVHNAAESVFQKKQQCTAQSATTKRRNTRRTTKISRNTSVMHAQLEFNNFNAFKHPSRSWAVFICNCANSRAHSICPIHGRNRAF